MKLEQSITILYSEDVQKSIDYFKNQLAFDNSWIYDADGSFGGVSKDGVEVFFCRQGQGAPGTWLCIIVDNVDEYYDEIRTRGAVILEAPESKEWNMREMYVQTPDRHIIRFGSRIDSE